jgi:bifunctional DNA-binding transcriptional regulator/antitoxin component of YhaV-PrlF toxin-antitoxin module
VKKTKKTLESFVAPVQSSLRVTIPKNLADYLKIKEGSKLKLYIEILKR